MHLYLKGFACFTKGRVLISDYKQIIKQINLFSNDKHDEK